MTDAQWWLSVGGTAVIALAFCWALIAVVDGPHVAWAVTGFSLAALAVIGAAVYGWVALVMAVAL